MKFNRLINRFTLNLTCNLKLNLNFNHCGFILGVLLLSSCSTPVKQQDEPVTEIEQAVSNIPLSKSGLAALKDAVEMLNNADFKSANKALKKLKKTFPDQADILANLAVSEYHLGGVKKAKLNANKTRQSPVSQNLLGLIALDELNPTLAEQHFVKATQLAPSYPLPFYNLGLVYDTYYQDLKNAIEYYRAYLVLSDFKDKDVLDWVKELEFSLNENQ